MKSGITHWVFAVVPCLPPLRKVCVRGGYSKRGRVRRYIAKAAQFEAVFTTKPLPGIVLAEESMLYFDVARQLTTQEGWYCLFLVFFLGRPDLAENFQLPPDAGWHRLFLYSSCVVAHR